MMIYRIMMRPFLLFLISIAKVKQNKPTFSYLGSISTKRVRKTADDKQCTLCTVRELWVIRYEMKRWALQ